MNNDLSIDLGTDTCLHTFYLILVFLPIKKKKFWFRGKLHHLLRLTHDHKDHDKEVSNLIISLNRYIGR